MKYLALCLMLFSLPVQAGECPSGPYVYNAEIISVYDADSVTATVDLGFHTYRLNEKFRLFGIDAPEMRGSEKPQGTISRDWLREQISGKAILLQSIKDGNRLRGKYGRYLAKLYIETDGGCLNLNDELVNNGLAEYRSY